MTKLTQETEDVVAGLRHKLDLIRAEYAAQGKEAQATFFAQLGDLIQSLSDRIDVLEGLLREARQHVRTVDGIMEVKIDVALHDSLIKEGGR